MRPVRDWSPSARPRSASPNPPYRTAGRYQAMADRYGPVALDPAVCGLHVHVGVPDRELAVQVCNHLQAWLPVIRALGGNSPLYQGADSGHASWRSVQLLRWPGVGPTPVMRLGRRLPPYGRGADRRRRDAR
jgi:glutamate---cysteine ligase / carboxylate-amine ligase